MKTTSIIALILLMLFQSKNTFSQVYHVPGQKAFSFTIGSTEYSPFGRYKLEANFIKREREYFKTSLSIDQGNIGLINYSDYLASFSYSRIFYDYKGRFFASGVGGLVAGYQTYHSEVLGSNTGSFIYGLSIGPELEYFFYKGLGIDFEFNQMMTFGSDLSGESKSYYFHYAFNLGLKYIF